MGGCLDEQLQRRRTPYNLTKPKILPSYLSVSTCCRRTDPPTPNVKCTLQDYSADFPLQTNSGENRLVSIFFFFFKHCWMYLWWILSTSTTSSKNSTSKWGPTRKSISSPVLLNPVDHPAICVGIILLLLENIQYHTQHNVIPGNMV